LNSYHRAKIETSDHEQSDKGEVLSVKMANLVEDQAIVRSLLAVAVKAGSSAYKAVSLNGQTWEMSARLARLIAAYQEEVAMLKLGRRLDLAVKVMAVVCTLTTCREQLITVHINTRKTQGGSM